MFTGHESEASEISVPSDGQKLVADISSYHLNEDLSDISLLVDKEQFPAHKVILASRSQYFKSWFKENPGKTEMTIAETSPQAFRILLRYIYTDAISIPSENELILQLLILAREYSLKEFSSGIVGKLDKILDTENVVFFLNGANDHDLDELRVACHLFIDANPLEILPCDTFNFLTQESLMQVLIKDTFGAPEIEIFKSVAKWCERNNSSDNSLVLECIRFSALSVSEITSIVGPTKLVKPERLYEIISEIVANSSEHLVHLATSSVDENVATLERGAQVIFPYNLDGPSSRNRNVRKNVEQTMDKKNTVVIKLSGQSLINHIRMKLYDVDKNCYSYYIETSLDQEKWHRIIDYTRYSCRSVQNLYFDQQTVQYIKIVGTDSSEGNDFHLVFIEAFYKNIIPSVIEGVIRPEKNVATTENGAIVIQGINPQHLLDGNPDSYAGHRVGASQAVIVHLSQPYLISTMHLELFGNGCRYKYFIQTSVNGTDWEIAVDRRNEECKYSQYLHFKARVVVFVKIYGIYSSFNKYFYCSHFECPSNPKK